MILLTGGAGFIGSNLFAAFQAAHPSVPVVVVDVLGMDDKWQNLKNRELYRLYRPAQLSEALAAHCNVIDTVFHMGAISSTTEKDADLVVETNIQLSQQLWHWCAANDKRFIYASSASVYGNGSAGFNDAATLEQMQRYTPLNPYAWSKLAFDRYAVRQLNSHAKKPQQWAGLRFFNVYGANEYHKGGQQSVIPQFTRQIQETGRCRLFKSHHPDYQDGGQLRDFVHVDDVVRVMLWLYDTPEVSGIFNVGSGKARSFNDLANAVFKALGKAPAIDYIDMPGSLRRAYQYFTEAELTALRAAGYTAETTSLEDGVAAYVQGYLLKEDMYR
ncbi:MAG: ADP-glyceromanno-heptose 6-epimerase [Alphaproteobacteria bacterium]|nr:ADP-glyceromanno-heptose 6-epimerase [Thalassospira sp.]MCE2965878.1 ADP-glyceromanno-heptose 6-epimerase [Alphaproteobacteria bacterium]